jgi:hypothetical protein
VFCIESIRVRVGGLPDGLPDGLPVSVPVSLPAWCFADRMLPRRICFSSSDRHGSAASSGSMTRGRRQADEEVAPPTDRRACARRMVMSQSWASAVVFYSGKLLQDSVIGIGSPRSPATAQCSADYSEQDEDDRPGSTGWDPAISG